MFGLFKSKEQKAITSFWSSDLGQQLVTHSADYFGPGKVWGDFSAETKEKINGWLIERILGVVQSTNPGAELRVELAAMTSCYAQFAVLLEGQLPQNLRSRYVSNELHSKIRACAPHNKEVAEETWRNPVVIPDPYESEEQEAGYGEGVLWFGHQSNLKTVEPYYDVVTNILTAQDWSREAQLKAIHDCGVVVIPTSDKKGKSANRLIEAVRNGRFVVAGELPAHEEFKQFMWIGDIREGISWAASHKSECISRVKDCQDYIRDRFSPETIGQMWYATIKEVFHGNNFIR